MGRLWLAKQRGVVWEQKFVDFLVEPLLPLLRDVLLGRVLQVELLLVTVVLVRLWLVRQGPACALQISKTCVPILVSLAEPDGAAAVDERWTREWLNCGHEVLAELLLEGVHLLFVLL